MDDEYLAPGCWEVTAKVGTRRLTFVVRVIRE